MDRFFIFLRYLFGCNGDEIHEVMLDYQKEHDGHIRPVGNGQYVWEKEIDKICQSKGNDEYKS